MMTSAQRRARAAAQAACLHPRVSQVGTSAVMYRCDTCKAIVDERPMTQVATQPKNHTRDLAIQD